MKLALFDLDHTLIDFDSGMAWTQHLVEQGVLGAADEQRYLDFCHQYVAGTLDIHAMQRAVMVPLMRVDPDRLQQWRRQFAQSMARRLSAGAKSLVAGHRERGDLCAIVTATSRWVAEPSAQAFGIGHLVATEWAMKDGRPGGAIDGLPCYREHKPTRVEAWLAGLGLPPLAAFEASWFYSDSASDIALLQCVTHPVAVRPDPRLRERCRTAGWPVIEAL